MYLSLIANYNIRPCKAQYLWVFYKQLQHFNENEITYILNEEYLKKYSDKERWEMEENEAKNHFYTPPKDINVKNYINYKFNETSEVPSLNLIEFSQNYIEHFHNILNNIDYKKYKIGLSCVNNNTYKSFLNSKNIPVIFNELGALRRPFWKSTFYFDFSGVNGGTEFDKRLQKFRDICNRVNLFNREELLKLISNKQYTNLLISILNDKSIKNKHGIALQDESDTNIICYNNNFNIKDILSYGVKKYGYNNIIVRNHPGSTLKASTNIYNISDDCNSIEFINKVDNIITINSSLAFEGLLLGKNAEIKGQNPFKSICSMDEKDKLIALNFAVISYLQPVELWYDKDYYNFRLKCFDELELYKLSLERLIRNYGKS